MFWCWAWMYSDVCAAALIWTSRKTQINTCTNISLKVTCVIVLLWVFFFFFTLHHNNKCRIYFCSANMYSSTFKNDLKQMKVPDDMKGSIVHVVNYTVIKHSLSIESYIWHRHSGWPFLTSLNFQRFFSMCLCVTSYHISLTANNRKRSPSTALLMPLSF